MNKKTTVMLAAVMVAGAMFARPGPGPRGGHGFRGGPPPVHHRVPGPPHHHHRHHCALGIAGAVLGTAAIVNEIVNPPPVVVAPAPVVVNPAPVVVPQTTVVTPAPVCTTTTYVTPTVIRYSRW